jgi:hypothetical protein
MKRILISVGLLAVAVLSAPRLRAQQQQPAAMRPKVLAFFSVGGELDHFLFAQQAMRALGATAGAGAGAGYTLRRPATGRS